MMNGDPDLSDTHRQGALYERFHGVSYMRSSFPKFNVAQGHSTFSSSSEADHADEGSLGVPVARP